jgi:hypothetical protein
MTGPAALDLVRLRRDVRAAWHASKGEATPARVELLLFAVTNHHEQMTASGMASDIAARQAEALAVVVAEMSEERAHALVERARARRLAMS